MFGLTKSLLASWYNAIIRLDQEICSIDPEVLKLRDPLAFSAYVREQRQGLDPDDVYLLMQPEENIELQLMPFDRIQDLPRLNFELPGVGEHGITTHVLYWDIAKIIHTAYPAGAQLATGRVKKALLCDGNIVIMSLSPEAAKYAVRVYEPYENGRRLAAEVRASNNIVHIDYQLDCDNPF